MLVKSNKKLECPGVDDFIIKVADFGLAHFVDDQSILSTSTFCGTPMYIAPEVKETNGQKVKYTKQGDIWSMGIIMLECFWSTAEFSVSYIIIILGCPISICGSKNALITSFFIIFGETFFQYWIRVYAEFNPIGLLRIGHVFVSIYRRFQKMGVFQCCKLILKY